MGNPALEKIQKLLEKHAEVLKEGRVSKYNEEMTKKDFILPLFDALGWKTDDSREVTAEEKISKKRVDYGFRIDGIPQFFLEAKSLKEDLDNPKFFEQAVSYAWHKGCTWAVLTNFTRVKILNAEWRARNYLQSHFMTLEHWEFVKRFEDLFLLSKDSFEKDKLDKLAEKYGKKTKKESVDKQLLNDFTRFRTLLSRNITKLNEHRNLSEEELDESVQRILDRLIFIRNCEDRELEPKNLISNYRQWTSRGKGKLVKSLRDDFAYFDEQYNSKLFAEHLCDSLEIDNEILEDIIVGLYYTKDKAIYYDFSIIDADVLGTIYEQYLGHVLEKTKKRAKVTKSRVHRKEQGIYYTPTYVVDYIVRNTFSELFKKKRLNVEEIKVLDPACGSGSFLIKAFDVLNSYYEKNCDHEQTELDLKTGVPFTTKVKILRNNIFGVDLDKQAVEIAQLNLLLKIAEKGNRLPILEQNIKCGNSLISDEKIAGDKAFKWREQFKRIMQKGGFSIIMGNPPYGASFTNAEKDFIKKAYKSASGRYDSFYYFIERSITLLKDGGLLGFITPDTWLTNVQTEALREFILENCRIIKIVSLPQDVFPEANVDTCIVIIQKEKKDVARARTKVTVALLGKDSQLVNLQQEIFEKKFRVTQERWMKNNRSLFNIYQNKYKLVEKVKKGSVLLGEISDMCRGINPYAKSEFIKRYGKKRGTRIVEKRLWHSDRKINEKYKKELVGSDIGKYSLNWKSGKWIKYGEWLSRPRDPKYFINPHLVVQRIRNPKLKIRLVATFIDPVDEYYNNSGLTNILITNNDYSMKYVLAILNSKLMNWYYRQFFRDVNIKPEDLRQLPIKSISKSQQKYFAILVDKILVLHNRLNELGDKITDERAKLNQEIAKTEDEIDELLYETYRLTVADRETIEKSFK